MDSGTAGQNDLAGALMPLKLPWWWPRVLIGLAFLPFLYGAKAYLKEADYPITILNTRVLRTGEVFSTTDGPFLNPRAFTVPAGTACLMVYEGGAKDRQIRNLWSGPCISPQQRAARPDLQGPTAAPTQQLTLRPKALDLECLFSWQSSLGDGGCAPWETTTRWGETLKTDQGPFELQLPSAQVLPHLGQAVCATVKTIDPPGDRPILVKIVTGLQAAPCTPT